MSLAHVRNLHGLQIMQPRHPTIRSLGKADGTPSLYGTQVWRSSFMLMEYLAANPMSQGQRVMELGCGWGLLGIYCAKHFPVEVLLTDADRQVFPYVETHAQLNRVKIRTKQVRFDGISEGCLREHDILLGADICFWPELGTQLRRLIRRAMSFGVGQILLADPGRSTFLQLAKDCKRQFGATLVPWQTASRDRSGGFLLIIDSAYTAGMIAT